MEGFWENEPSTNSPRNAENLNLLASGWTPFKVGDTLTYSSADSPTFVVSTNRDLRGYLSLGMKLRLTHGGSTKYFFITAITSNSITLYGGTDYTLSATAITEVFFSVHKSPYGFPINPDKWTIQRTLSTNYFKASPVQNTIYYTGFSLTVPIGCWELSFSSIAYADRESSGTAQCSLGLASNQTTLDLFLSIQQTLNYSSGVTGTLLILPINPKRLINLSSKTTYYLNIKTVVTGIGSIGSVNEGETYIKAICAYL